MNEKALHSAEAAVYGAHQARITALIKGDKSAMAELLSPNLHYIHAPGRLDNRDSYLDFLQSVRFVEVEVADRKIRVMGEVAILTGVLRMKLLREGEETPVSPVSAITEVWHRQELGHWTLVNFQSTSVQ